MKYFVFSIDDGTIFDRDVISLFNRYGVKGTFNLNSGLSNFTWYYNDEIPITRLILEDNIHLYDGHEVASHTLTHPYLDRLEDDKVIMEVKRDKKNLEAIFNRKIESFATPFETAGEREVEIIKNNIDISNIRLSSIDESFAFPKDSYHIKVTALDIDRALELIEEFMKIKDGAFIYAGHSYDFYVNNSFSKLEKLLDIITKEHDVKICSMQEFIKEVFKDVKRN